MTLLRTSAVGIAAFAVDGGLGARIAEQMSHDLGRRPAPAEIRSWDRSLTVLAQDLISAGLDQVEMLIEYRLPLTSQRVDVILAGRHPKLHPGAQVTRYCEYLLDFTRVLQDLKDPISGVAYLHNATDAGVEDLREREQSHFSRLFTGQRRADFLDHLRSRLTPDAEVGDLLLSSAVSPGRQLLALAADEVQRRESFRLVGDQQLAYDLVLHAVGAARRSNRKTAIVVSGGPGSGKSVVALSLLGELARQGRSVLHATGSRSFTRTLRQVAGRRSPRTKALFKYFNQFVDAEANGLDVLILDEAHRIRETSADRWTRSQFRTGKPQVDELLAAARVPVFLLDEHQVVRPGEMGTVEDIARHASAQGIQVQRITLGEQFRCGGSKEYENWVLRLLGLAEGGPIPWLGDEYFDVRVADTPSEMELRLGRLLEEGFGARMAAGYCWPWSDPKDDGSLVPDVQIDRWSHPWNLRGERSVGGAPPAPLWATDPAGFGQVGCVYTAQGFEYDWNGVIIGPDLVWRRDHWISVRDANKDPDFRNRTKVGDREFDHLVRNVYKVLLTRGMRGTVLYSTDRETRTFLHSLVPSRASLRTTRTEDVEV